MGNSNQHQKPQSISKNLPFYTRPDQDYNLLSEQTNQNALFKCSLKNRLIGFVACCAIGWFLSILAVIAFLIKHNTVQFAILYSLGQIINITGSCFLATPKKQYKNMTNTSRLTLSVLYLLSIVVTIALALTLPQNLSFLIFISLILQVIAYFFYTLSYIPGGRRVLKKLCRFMVE